MLILQCLFLLLSAVFVLPCQLGEPQPTRGLVSVSFEFWYAVGTQDASVLDFSRIRFEMEQLIFMSIDGMILRCREINTTNFIGDGDRRLRLELFDSAITQRLGIVTYTPGRNDNVVPDELCPEELTSGNFSSSCLVVKGEMTIIAIRVEVVDSAVQGLREGIKQAMDSGIGQNNEVIGIDYLSYLGDTHEAAFAGAAAGGGVVLLKAIGGRRGVAGFGTLMKTGIPLFIVLLVIIALLMIPKRKRKLHVFHETVDVTEEPPATTSKLHGTGDHPDSVHQGSYHFTPKGQHYLSTNCVRCFMTRQECFAAWGGSAPKISAASNTTSFWGDDVVLSPRRDAMATILEDQPLGSRESPANTPLPIVPNMNHGISKSHWGMDVHNCGSATCTRCATGTGRPVFFRVCTSPTDESAENILVDPYLKTSPVHGEV